MTCPYLEYREAAGEQSFDEPRAFCGVVSEFVQPMRADVCNDRYDLAHGEHCEIFRAHEESEDGRHDDEGEAASEDERGGRG